jgi:hypothetical protein
MQSSRRSAYQSHQRRDEGGEMSELLLCPFCGNEKSPMFKRIDNTCIFVECEEYKDGCSAQSPKCSLKEDAIAAWNLRANGWISVKDRLPEDRVYVLVAFGQATRVSAFSYCYKSEEGIWYRSDGYQTSADITHWMPLPEPPATGECDG